MYTGTDDLGLPSVTASPPSEIMGMIWASVMDRAVCVQISNDSPHPFQMVAVKSISMSHTHNNNYGSHYLCVASAPTEKLLPRRAAGECIGDYLLNTHKGTKAADFHSLSSPVLTQKQGNAQPL